jgi:nitroimidazol reductase NimA-like FMN-containing flavoprotein (pyridoxamine 5'-phosphate oxidase superfamily)
VPIPREQLRLSAQELEELLRATREVHVATASPDGVPHVAPLWFVWHDGALWVTSLIKSRRTRDIRSGSPVAVCADAGTDYAELRGAVLHGRFVDASDDPGLADAKRAYAAKYWGDAPVPEVRSHTWLKLVPDEIASWDFRKIPPGRDRRLEARRARS